MKEGKERKINYEQQVYDISIKEVNTSLLFRSKNTINISIVILSYNTQENISYVLHNSTIL